MAWNWQSPDWPQFSWSEGTLRPYEDAFLRQAGVLIGTSSHLEEAESSSLTIELMSCEAVDTSRIEGLSLDRHSVQASIRRHLGLTPVRRSDPAENAIAEMMVDLYRGYSEPLTEGRLFAWHKMMMSGQRGVGAVGRYRDHEDPMQIVSGGIGQERVHFEAPPSHLVPEEMARFLVWLNGGDKAAGKSLPAVTRVGIAHLWFESIHPFEDGNGRIGRAIVERALAHAVGQPLVTGVSGALLRRRKDYYAQLGAASRTLDVTRWLEWFACAALEAQQHTISQISFVIQKGRLLAAAEAAMNQRQRKAVLRMFAEGLSGFQGGLSAANYMRITGAPVSTASRDLAALVALGILRRTGERKGTRYHLNIQAPEPSVLDGTAAR